MEEFKRDGFVPLFRHMMKWDLWKKPLHYLKIFMFLYMRAAYQDTDYLKRGQLETSRKELKDVCCSGVGQSRTEITPQQVHHALEYLKNDFKQCPIKWEEGRHDEMRITLLNYEALAVGNGPGMNGGYAGNMSGTHEGCTGNTPGMYEERAGDARGISSNIYNNIKNNKKTNIKTDNYYSGNARPSRFNNFTPRTKNYDEILKRKKEEVKRLAQQYMEEEGWDLNGNKI